MKVEVTRCIEELKRQFTTAIFTIKEDGQGGAYVLMEPVALGPKFQPPESWMGFQITAQYPYADIYPVFIGDAVRRSNGVPFAAPVTLGHQFEGRAAIQVSRRNSAAQNGQQNGVAKILKILSFLDSLS